MSDSTSNFHQHLSQVPQAPALTHLSEPTLVNFLISKFLPQSMPKTKAKSFWFQTSWRHHKQNKKILIFHLSTT